MLQRKALRGAGTVLVGTAQLPEPPSIDETTSSWVVNTSSTNPVATYYSASSLAQGR